MPRLRPDRPVQARRNRSTPQPANHAYQRQQEAVLTQALNAAEAQLRMGASSPWNPQTFTVTNQWTTITTRTEPESPEPAREPMPYEVEQGSLWSLSQVQRYHGDWRSHFDSLQADIDYAQRNNPTDVPHLATLRGEARRAWELSEAWRNLENRISVLIAVHAQVRRMQERNEDFLQAEQTLLLKIDAMRSAHDNMVRVLNHHDVNSITYLQQLDMDGEYNRRSRPRLTDYAGETLSTLDRVIRDHSTYPQIFPAVHPGNVNGVPFIINGNKVKIRLKAAARNRISLIVSTERGSYAKAVMSLVEKRVGLCFYRSENNFREIDHGFKLMDSDRGLIIAERKE